MARVRELHVWLHGAHVATLRSPGIGKVRLQYTPAALDRYALGIPLLSCSLPLRTGPQDARPFAGGLLPEGQHRQAMAGLAGVTVDDILGLLVRFGRDVAGAVVITKPGETDVREGSGAATVEPYGPGALEQAVSELGDHPLGLFDDSELSLPGLQDKMLLVRLADGRWGRPVHGWPSTHILKLDDRLRPGLVRAEHTCLRLARLAGLPAAASELVKVAELECLIVERFDRRASTSGSAAPAGLAPSVRVHQEDGCQATGVDMDRDRGRAKYEQYGGPRLRSIAALLDAWGGIDQVWALLDQVLLTVVIGNADAHAKNIGLLHLHPGTITLAPAYDTVPTVLWPKLDTRAALSIGGCVDLPSVGRTDLLAEARAWGLNRQDADGRIDDALRRLAEAAASAEIVDLEPRVSAAVIARTQSLLAR